MMNLSRISTTLRNTSTWLLSPFRSKEALRALFLVFIFEILITDRLKFYVPAYINDKQCPDGQY
jgi:hypothetical protein